MALLDYAGYAAALCTTGAYVPQVVKVWRTRATQDISLKMFLVLVTGLSLWLAYGIHRGEWPLIAANSVTLCLAGIILYFKLQQVRRDRAGNLAGADRGACGRNIDSQGERPHRQRKAAACAAPSPLPVILPPPRSSAVPQGSVVQIGNCGPEAPTSRDEG